MTTQWIKTDFKGVRYRKHPTRRHGVQFDRYYTVAYKLDGKTKTEGIGWASDGVKPSDVYNDLSALKRNQKAGERPRTFAEKREMAKAERKKEAARSITLDQYWGNYLDYAKRSKKQSSWSKEESHYRLWLSPLLGDVALIDIDLIEWDTLVEALSRDNKSQRTKEYITGTLRRILKHAYHRGVIEEAPPSGKRIGVCGPGNSNRRLRVIRPDEAELILSELAAKDTFAWRITLFAFLTGCRASEAFNLRWRDVDLVRGEITFPETKNRDSRKIPISEPLRILFSDVQQEIASNQNHIFTQSNGKPYSEAPSAFRTVVDNQGLNKGHAPRNRITFHSIRHSVATELAKRLNLRDLMEVMGWRTVQMAMRYVHGDEREKRNALAGLESTLKPRKGKILDWKDLGGEKK